MDNLVETAVMVAGACFLIAIAYRFFYRWLHSPSTMSRIKLGRGGKLKEDDPNISLLEKHGYSVISGRHQVPVAMEVDGNVLERSATIIIDYVAEKKGRSYIVKTERERTPIEMNAADLKKHLLIYSLLLPEMSGVLYINSKESKIHQIVFHLAD